MRAIWLAATGYTHTFISLIVAIFSLQQPPWVTTHLFPLFSRPPNIVRTTFRGDEESTTSSTTDVSFYCRPYLLQLSLPGDLCTEDDEDVMQTTDGGGTGSVPKAVYDPDLDCGTLFITLYKCNKGEWLPDLELISNLLRPSHHHPPQRSGGAGIEVISSSSTLTDVGSTSSTNEVVVESRNDESSSSKAAVDIEEDLAQGFQRVVGLGSSETPSLVMYGFNGRHSCIFRDLRDDLGDIVELPLPDETPVESRTILREEQEAKDFDPERYIGDLIYGDEDYILKDALAVQMPLFVVGMREKGSEYLTEEERQQLAALRPSPIMGSRGLRIQAGSADERAAMNGLADVICGFAYDFRTTCGEKNVESSWTCTILSSTLSWLEPWGLLCPECEEAQAITDPSRINGPKAVVRSFIRRVLCYPYLRRWDLAIQCAKDSTNAIQGGKRSILRALLYLHSAIEHSDSKYLLNKLYITDFIIWVQSPDLTEKCLTTYAKQMKVVIDGLKKDDVDFCLDEYEAMVPDETQSIITDEYLTTRQSRGDSSSSCYTSSSTGICIDSRSTSPSEDKEGYCISSTGTSSYEEEGGKSTASLPHPSRVLITEL